MRYKVQGNGYLHGLALNFASTHQTEIPRGFSEVGESQQLLIANFGRRNYLFVNAFSVLVKCV